MASKAKRPQLRTALLGGLIGLASFLILYGVAPLNVTQDGWILATYDEWDILQRYVGWTNFRHAPWSFPLGQSANMAYPAGCNIAFMDAIPLVSLFFKVLSPLLPAVFQFEGLYMLLVFVLQGVSAALLVGLFVPRLVYTGVATVFFTFSPVLIERGFRHSSLASHYLILFAMYLYFKTKQRIFAGQPVRLPWLGMGVLSFVSVGITPYFMPMVMIFVLLTAADYMLFTKARRRVLAGIGFFAANCAIALASSYLIGSFGHGTSASRDGFGQYSMNLNALVNPRSVGEYRWSMLLPQLGQAPDQYDGFNYLGAGMLLFILAALVACAVCWMRSQRRKELARTLLKKYGLLAMACLFLTCFAVSHIVVLGDTVFFTLPLPQRLVELGGIFRASARLFYPVYYGLYLFAVVACARLCAALGKSQKIALLLLGLMLAVQMFDLNHVIREKHGKMRVLSGIVYDGPAELLELGEYSMLVGTPGGARYTLYLTGRNNLPTNLADTNTGKNEEAVAFGEQQFAALRQGQMNPDYVYMTESAEEYALWQALYADRANFYEWVSTIDAQLYPHGYQRFWRGTLYFMVPVRAG